MITIIYWLGFIINYYWLRYLYKNTWRKSGEAGEYTWGRWFENIGWSFVSWLSIFVLVIIFLVPLIEDYKCKTKPPKWL